MIYRKFLIFIFSSITDQVEFLLGDITTVCVILVEHYNNDDNYDKRFADTD